MSAPLDWNKLFNILKMLYRLTLMILILELRLTS